eukprot:g9973.t1
MTLHGHAAAGVGSNSKETAPAPPVPSVLDNTDHDVVYERGVLKTLVNTDPAAGGANKAKKPKRDRAKDSRDNSARTGSAGSAATSAKGGKHGTIEEKRELERKRKKKQAQIVSKRAAILADVAQTSWSGAAGEPREMAVESGTSSDNVFDESSLSTDDLAEFRTLYGGAASSGRQDRDGTRTSSRMKKNKCCWSECLGRASLGRVTVVRVLRGFGIYNLLAIAFCDLMIFLAPNSPEFQKDDDMESSSSRGTVEGADPHQEQKKTTQKGAEARKSPIAVAFSDYIDRLSTFVRFLPACRIFTGHSCYVPNLSDKTKGIAGQTPVAAADCVLGPLRVASYLVPQAALSIMAALSFCEWARATNYLSAWHPLSSDNVLSLYLPFNVFQSCVAFAIAGKLFAFLFATLQTDMIEKEGQNYPHGAALQDIKRHIELTNQMISGAWMFVTSSVIQGLFLGYLMTCLATEKFRSWELAPETSDSAADDRSERDDDVEKSTTTTEASASLRGDEHDDNSHKAP